MKPIFILVTFGLSSSVWTGIWRGCPRVFISAALKKWCSNSWSCETDYAAVGEIERPEVPTKLHSWHTVSRLQDYTAFKQETVCYWTLVYTTDTLVAFIPNSCATFMDLIMHISSFTLKYSLLRVCQHLNTIGVNWTSLVTLKQTSVDYQE